MKFLKKMLIASLLASAILGCSAATSADADDAGRQTERDTGRERDSQSSDEVTGEISDQIDVPPDDTNEATDSSDDLVAPDIEQETVEQDSAEEIETDVDSTPEPDTDTGPTIDEDCEQLEALGEQRLAPVDIIWVVDTSGSMVEEAAIIESELARFVTYFEALSLDWRVVMISGPEQCAGCLPEDMLDVCVPEPLSGAPGCPDTDGPRFRHVREFVGSFDSLEVIDRTWPQFQDFLRPDAVTHFVLVSDDESENDASWFQAQMLPRLPGGFVFHSIVSLTETEDCFLFICETLGCEGPHGSAESQGNVYMELSNRTGGTLASICDGSWTPIFDEIAEGVVQGASLPCEFVIPPPPYGEIVFDSVTVDFTPTGGSPLEFVRVDSAAACSVGNQWYFDNNDAPTRIHLCASACGDRDGELNIHFGCIKA